MAGTTDTGCYPQQQFSFPFIFSFGFLNIIDLNICLQLEWYAIMSVPSLVFCMVQNDLVFNKLFQSGHKNVYASLISLSVFKLQLKQVPITKSRAIQKHFNILT